eukprot:TRINITY_DN9702_c0_g1_i1.p1 TRINITY_DN9702_c0_g1~~TRINITY_DN9702_c0_g1_i1.p1  ORF type:complete len:312 (+),score=90.82 TRINITY_DN9702_c0_g1_i1:126-1061(+)
MEGQWFSEKETDTCIVMFKIEKNYVRVESEYQDIHVVDLARYGRTLFLDDMMQSSQTDEYIYHEMLVHPAMLMHPDPKLVFIGGGGEGGTLREVLRHKSVEKAVMVDIDQKCVEACKEFMPMFHQGAFDDERSEVIFDDAKKYLEETDLKFDVIILDLADPLDDGPCKYLYTKEFYEMCSERLSPNGVIVTQSGPASYDCYKEMFLRVKHTLGSAYPTAEGLQFFVKSFHDFYSTVISSKIEGVSPSAFTISQIDEMIQERIIDPSVLRYYDGVTHLKATLLDDKQIRKDMDCDDTSLIITNDNVINYQWD